MHHLLNADALRKVCTRAAHAVKQGAEPTAWVGLDPALCRLVVVHRGYQNKDALGLVALGEYRTDATEKAICNGLVCDCIRIRGDGADLEILDPKPAVYDHL